MRYLLFTLLLLQGFSGAYGSGFEFTPNCKAAYQKMLQLDFTSATTILSKEKTVNPENAAPAYIAHYIDFLRAFISEEDRDFLQLKNNFDLRLEQVEKGAAGTAWMNMAHGEMIMQLAIVKLKRKEYISAGYYIRRSYKLLEENQIRYPKFIPHLKGLGFFHALIGAVPENYKWLSNLVGLKGTISQGGNELSLLINQLEKDDELEFLMMEACLLKIFIATHLEKNYASALALLEKTKKNKTAENPLLVFMESNTHIISGNSKEGLKILDAFRPQPGHFHMYYLDYATGMLKLNNLDPDASEHFIRFVTGYKGKSFIKSAYHKLGWLALLQNDTAGYYKFMENVKRAGDDFTDEDKQALKEAMAHELPNSYLLRSRLLFDGGNYNDALAELAGKPTSSFPKFRDQLEFTYRLARIFDKKGQTEKAIQYYSKTYENGMRTEWYFAANAALHNGMLYENKGDKLRAQAWYRKCLDLRDHEYQNSIDQKAEAGLNRIAD